VSCYAFRNTEGNSTRLSAGTSTTDESKYIVSAENSGNLERADDPFTISGYREVLCKGDVVDKDCRCYQVGEGLASL